MKMKKISIYLLSGIIAVCYSCKTQEKNDEFDSFLYGEFKEVGHTKYVYNMDKDDGSYSFTEETTENGNTYHRQGECCLLPCGMIIEEQINNGLLAWIISDLTNYEKAIKSLKNSKHVKSPNSYSINSSKHIITITMNGASSYGFNYVYRLYYKNQYGYLVLSEIRSFEDEGYGSGEAGSIIYKIEDGHIISMIKDYQDLHNITYYNYDVENLFCSYEECDYEIDTYSKKETFTQFVFDKTNKLIKTIMTSHNMDYSIEYEQNVIEYEQRITEYTYQDGKIIDSNTKQRKSILPNPLIGTEN